MDAQAPHSLNSALSLSTSTGFRAFDGFTGGASGTAGAGVVAAVGILAGAGAAGGVRESGAAGTSGASGTVDAVGEVGTVGVTCVTDSETSATPNVGSCMASGSGSGDARGCRTIAENGLVDGFRSAWCPMMSGFMTPNSSDASGSSGSGSGSGFAADSAFDAATWAPNSLKSGV